MDPYEFHLDMRHGRDLNDALVQGLAWATYLADKGQIEGRGLIQISGVLEDYINTHYIRRRN